MKRLGLPMQAPDIAENPTIGNPWAISLHSHMIFYYETKVICSSLGVCGTRLQAVSHSLRVVYIMANLRRYDLLVRTNEAKYC
jgi:hypothetical protein